MAMYEDEMEKFNLSLDEANMVSGGVVDVSLNDYCHKQEGDFLLLEEKTNKWKNAGCPKTCEFCWNLKYDGNLYCDV